MTVGIESTALRTSPPRAEPPTPEATPITAAQTPQTGLAVRGVTDGDTFTLDDGGRVRLAQVDAPETNECFGPQSTGSLQALVCWALADRIGQQEGGTFLSACTGLRCQKGRRTQAELMVPANVASAFVMRHHDPDRLPSLPLHRR